MRTLLDSFEAWLPALLNLSWKGSLLTLAVALVLWAAGRHLSPAWRHGLWLLVLLRFVLPDLGVSGFSLASLATPPAAFAVEKQDAPPPAADVSPAAIPLPDMPPLMFAQEETMEHPEPAASLHPAPAPSHRPQDKTWTWRQGLGLLWLAGALFIFTSMMALHLRLLRRIRRDATAPEAALREMLAESCALAGVRRVPRLIVTDAVAAPSLFGLLRPAILLPRAVAEQKDAANLRLIFLHELAHLRRGDLWTQLGASFVLVMHGLNPVVWFVVRRLRAEAEMAADARALRSSGPAEARRLGEMLLAFAARGATGWLVLLHSPSWLGICTGGRDLRHRMESLRRIAQGWRTRWITGFAILALLAFVGLSRAPADENKPAEADAQPAEKSEPQPAPSPAVSNTRSLTGMVADAEGKPVAGASVRVTINLYSNALGGNQRTTSDAEGRFKFETLPLYSSLLVSASHPDHAESSLLKLEGPDAAPEIRLTLPAIPWVTGTITDQRSGQPLKDARVFYALERPQIIKDSMSLFDWKFPSVRTDEAGAYRLPVKSRDARRILVRAWAPDMTSHSERITLTPEGGRFDSSLAPVPRIPAKVVSALGQPVKDALVFVVEDSLRLELPPEKLTAEWLRSQDRKQLVQCRMIVSLDYSGQDGSVRLHEPDALLREHQWIVALHPEEGTAWVHAADFAEGTLFKLSPWASLSGRLVREDGSAVASAEVNLSIRNQRSESERPALIFHQSLTLKTSETGEFQAAGLIPNSLLSSASIGGAYHGLQGASLSSGPQRARTLIARASSLMRKTGDSAETLRLVRGRIVMPEGMPLRSEDYNTSFILRRLDGAPTISPRLNENGSFITELPAPGRYQASLTITPKPGKGLFKPNNGRWLQFTLAPSPDAAPFELDEILLEKEDFELLPSPLDEPEVYGDEEQGFIELASLDQDRKPLPGARFEALDYLDFFGQPLGLEQEAARLAPIVTDAEAQTRLTFPRYPRPGVRAHGVRLRGVSGAAFHFAERDLLEGKKAEVWGRPKISIELQVTPALATCDIISTEGVVLQSPPGADGAIRATFVQPPTGAFMLRGATKEGHAVFSESLSARDHAGGVLRAEVRLAPGIEIEGAVENLPEGGSQDGFVSASLIVPPISSDATLRKGYPPSVFWQAWTPVDKDGRFRFPQLPRSQFASLRGMGRGWVMGDGSSILSGTSIIPLPSSAKVRAAPAALPGALQPLRLLFPDGSPAAGAALRLVSFSGPASMVAMPLSLAKNLIAEPEHREAHAAWLKEGNPALPQVADSEGRLTLPNVPAGTISVEVTWADPKTGHARRETLKFQASRGGELVTLNLSESGS